MSKLDWSKLVLPEVVTEEARLNAEEMGKEMRMSAIIILEMLGHDIGAKKNLTCAEYKELCNSLPHHSSVRAKVEALWDEEAEKQLRNIDCLVDAQSACKEVKVRSDSEPWRKLVAMRDKFAMEKVQAVLDAPDGKVNIDDIEIAEKLLWSCPQLEGAVVEKCVRYASGSQSGKSHFLFTFLNSHQIIKHQAIFDSVFSSWLGGDTALDILEAMRRSLRESEYLPTEEKNKRCEYTARVEEKKISINARLIEHCRDFRELSELFSRVPPSGGPEGVAFHIAALKKALSFVTLRDFNDYGILGSQSLERARKIDSELVDRIKELERELANKELETATDARTVLSLIRHFGDDKVEIEKWLRRAMSFIKTAKEMTEFMANCLNSAQVGLRWDAESRHEEISLSEVMAAKTLNQLKLALESCPGDRWEIQGNTSRARLLALRKMATYFYRIPEAVKTKAV